MKRYQFDCDPRSIEWVVDYLSIFGTVQVIEENGPAGGCPLIEWITDRKDAVDVLRAILYAGDPNMENEEICYICTVS